MLNFQNPNGPEIEHIVIFHDKMIMLILPLSILVLLSMRKSKISNRSFTDSQLLELLWTVAPGVLLMCLMIPSLRLLYLFEDGDRSYSTKVVGHQWYWQYEDVNSYLVKGYRLLEVDNRLQVVGRTKTLVTSSDVLHSWALPALGVKADAVPGRINSLTLHPKRFGLFFGQCREICGRNHSFIPISLEYVFNFVWYFESIVWYS